MKKIIVLLILFSPVLGMTQNTIDLPSQNVSFFHKQVFNTPGKFLNSMELLHQNYFIKPFSKLDPYMKLTEITGYEPNTDHELILRIREKFLKSVQTDTLLIDSLFKYTFKNPTDSTLTEKLFYSYNSSVNQCIITKCEWDTLTLQWYFTTKEDYFYDQNGNDTLMILYKRSTDDNWALNLKYINTYDLYKRLTSHAIYVWHDLTQRWRGQNKQVFEFDNYGNKTLEALYTWSDVRNTWQGSSKSEYSYDERSLLVLFISYNWDAKNFDWICAAKEENAYNEQGLQILGTRSQWDSDLKDWKYVIKVESETVVKEDGFYYYYAYYEWNIIFNRWSGLYKIDYSVGETEEAISYIWNPVEAKWEATVKFVSEMTESGLGFINKTFEAKDSIVIGEIINGFNSEGEFSNIWITPSCPDQICSALDSDRVEGNASILWNYNINGNYYANGGFCQVQMNTDKDMSQYLGLLINCKILIPSPASFILRVTETSGEVWMIENTQMLADSSGMWQQFVFPFSEMIGSGTFIDGIFDNKHIKNIQMRLSVPKGIKTSGTVLIDNLSTCNIIKTDKWLLTAFEDVLLDEHRNSIYEISKKWDTGLQQFVEDYKYKAEIEYNQFGLVTNSEAFIWEEPMEDWSNYRKEENAYNENGNIIRSESYTWNLLQSKWVGNSKFEQSFNKFGNILISITYQWDDLTDSWLNDSKTENTYTESGKLASNSNYNWYNTLQKWIGGNKHETVFNEFDEKIKTIEYVWDLKTDNWKVSTISLEGYWNDSHNADGNIIAHVFVAWNETLNNWSPKEKYYYFRSLHNITTEIPEILAHKRFVEVYPIPATDAIHIKINSVVFYGTFSLFSSNGFLLKKSDLTGNITSVQISDLPKGNYILHIKTDEFVESKKIIVH